MPSTNIDGTNMMILNEGSTVVLVVGDRTYSGILHMRKNASFTENWYITLTAVEPGEPNEIQIHKIAQSETIKAEQSETIKAE